MKRGEVGRRQIQREGSWGEGRGRGRREKGIRREMRSKEGRCRMDRVQNRRETGKE